jgi:hypothetical protein
LRITRALQTPGTHSPFAVFGQSRLAGSVSIQNFVPFVPFCSPFSNPDSDSTIGAGEDHSYDAIGQLQLVKIDDQSKWNVHELHITQELGFMNRRDLLHTFKFQQKAILDQNVEAEWLFKHQPFVFDFYNALIDGGTVAQMQFAHETLLINAFDQTRSFKPVDFDGGAYGHTAQLVGSVEKSVHVIFYTKQTKETKNFVKISNAKGDRKF